MVIDRFFQNISKSQKILVFGTEYKVTIANQIERFTKLLINAEIAGLTLTVPSWVSSIERARNNADMNAASTGAKSRLEEALLSLQEKVSEMLSEIREVD